MHDAYVKRLRKGTRAKNGFLEPDFLTEGMLPPERGGWTSA
jgi:hypothetical protein